MEEEKQIGEQPILETATAEHSANVNRAQDSNDGSLGKFKDTQSLLNAYNSLQAEFTKKCQMLSEIQKQNTDNVPEPVAPVYLDEDWTQKVYEFLENNKEAKPFAKQIAELIMSDKTLATNENALDLAWGKIATQNYKNPETVIEDDDFINNVVLNNSKVKAAVLENFAKQVQRNSPPDLINSKSGGTYGAKKPKTPLTLTDAKEMARKFFD